MVLDYETNVPPTHSVPEKTDVALQAACQSAVDGRRAASMDGEDFSIMPQDQPGALMFLGNAESAAMHTTAFDFDDASTPYACARFAALVQTELLTPERSV